MQRLAVHRTEAPFQGEHGTQAIAQVFSAAQAKTRAAAHALHAAEAALRITLELHFFVADTGIYQAVQRNGVGGLRCPGKAGQQRHGQKRLLHINPQNGEMKGTLRICRANDGYLRAAAYRRAAHALELVSGL
ncbi:hypothetical protein D3C86_1140150 [compost metagenome]